MIDDEASLIANIYEAGAMPERWPKLMSDIAQSMGARGGVLMCAKENLNLRTCSADLEDLVKAYEDGGWAVNNSRTNRLIESQPYPGFLADAALNTPEELNTLPVYTDFLVPQGMAAGAATIMQGAASDGFILAIEGFGSHAESIAAMPQLDGLRPHLARAAMLSGQLSLQRSRVAVEALAIMGTPAAMLDLDGRVLAANTLFEMEMRSSLLDKNDRLYAANKFSDVQLEIGIKKMIVAKTGSSLVIRDLGGTPAIALHLVPISGDARDIFERSAGLAILSMTKSSMLPSADLLQALFDLTPAEARVARAIGASQSVHDIAVAQGLGVETIRTHLKRAMNKANLRRQTEFAMLIKNYSPPIAN
ncbi:MAG: transcriptional regulator [Sphingomonadales bacterium]|nr:transcriptional regulator [Sphingomonadales bacterium]